MKRQRGRRGIQSIDTGIRLLEVLEQADGPLALKELSAGADLDRPLLGHDEPPLHVALKSKAPSRREMVAALLEIGAEVHPPGQEQPVRHPEAAVVLRQRIHVGEQVCGPHHRKVHEEGWTLKRKEDRWVATPPPLKVAQRARSA